MALQPPPSLFDAPIPGESLTASPGAMPWEKPPQFADPEQAIEYLFGRLSSHKVMEKTVSLMDAGVPLEGIAKMLTFTGFCTGRWTPDVAELIRPALKVYLLGMADKAGVTPVIEMEDPEEPDGDYEIRRELRPESLGLPPQTPPAPLNEEMPLPMEEAPMETAPQGEEMGGFMGMTSGGGI